MPTKSGTWTRAKAEKQLRQHFLERGYVRIADDSRRQKEGAKYKKGYEVRLVVNTQTELDQLRLWLEQTGFKPAKPFAKGHQIVQPVYGRTAVEWFLSGKTKEGD